MAPPASAQTDAVSVARALINAENAHDVNAAVNLFGPGAIVNLPTGALVSRGRALALTGTDLDLVPLAMAGMTLGGLLLLIGRRERAG